MSAAPLVLVADDEELVLEIASAFLARAGFRVALARDGVEALAVHERHKGEVALVVLDWSMPLLDGEAVLRELRRRESTLPVVISTGLGTLENRLEGLPGTRPPLLAKPYRSTALVEAVRSALSGSGGTPAAS